MHYLFTVTFICSKSRAECGHRKFLNGVHEVDALVGARVVFNSLYPQPVCDCPDMDDLLDRVKYSMGAGLWNEEPLLFNAFAVIDVDPIEGSLSDIAACLVADVGRDDSAHSVTWLPLENYVERNTFEEADAMTQPSAPRQAQPTNP